MGSSCKPKYVGQQISKEKPLRHQPPSKPLMYLYICINTHTYFDLIYQLNKSWFSGFSYFQVAFHKNIPFYSRSFFPPKKIPFPSNKKWRGHVACILPPARWPPWRPHATSRVPRASHEDVPPKQCRRPSARHQAFGADSQAKPSILLFFCLPGGRPQTIRWFLEKNGRRFRQLEDFPEIVPRIRGFGRYLSHQICRMVKSGHLVGNGHLILIVRNWLIILIARNHLLLIYKLKPRLLDLWPSLPQGTTGGDFFQQQRGYFFNNLLTQPFRTTKQKLKG